MRVTFVLSLRSCDRGPGRVFRILRGGPPEIFHQSAGSLTGAVCNFRLGTRLRTTTYKTGINSRFRVVAAIIPPKTVVPTEIRPARPAPDAKTSGTTPRMNASEVI